VRSLRTRYWNGARAFQPQIDLAVGVVGERRDDAYTQPKVRLTTSAMLVAGIWMYSQNVALASLGRPFVSSILLSF